MQLRRTFLCLSIGAALAASTAAHSAETWPNKPIRLIVPYAPGGLTDILARVVAQKASVTLGQPILIENKPGASTSIGASFVAKAPADGYTLLMAAATTLSTNPLLFKKLSYSASDFTPVALVGTVPFIAVTHPTALPGNLKDLIAYAKANPGKVTYSTSGQGSSSHLVGKMFEAATGVTLTDVPYKGSSPAFQAVLSGEVAMTFDGVTLYTQHIQSGRLKAVAVFGESRLPMFDKVPTMVEQGYRDAVARSWFGIVAPAATPRDVVGRVNEAVRKALTEPDVVARLRDFDVYVEPRSPEAFGEFMQRESALWSRFIEPLNIRLD
jgi:tripartite-type tricarboxylate transporter receptor subunit TctC